MTSGTGIRQRLLDGAAVQRLRAWPPDPSIVLFAISFLLLLGWWIAFYPGLISPDSVAYALQATGRGPWSSSYSVLYNALLAASFKITGGMALLTFAQVVTMAASLTYTATGLHRLGARWKWVSTVVIALSVLPVAGAFSAYLSKDVAFVIAEIFTLGVVVRIVRPRVTGEQVSTRWRPWFALFVGFFFMCLFRDNSVLMVAIAAGFLFIALPGLRRRVVVAAAAAVAGWATLMFGVYPAAGVLAADSSLVLGPAYADIAAAYQHSPASFTEADLSLMQEETPLSQWEKAKNCYTSDTLDVNGAWDREAGKRNAHELFKLWLRVLGRAPNVVVDARVCRGAIAWMPFPPAAGLSGLLPAGEPSNLKVHRAQFLPGDYHAMKADPPIAALRQAALVIEKASFAHSLEFILYRGATWAYVAYVAILLFVRRRRLRPSVGFGLIGLIVANQFVVFIDNPSQLIRYMLGCVFMGALLLTLVSADRTRAGPMTAREAATEDYLRPRDRPSGAGERQRHPVPEVAALPAKIRVRTAGCHAFAPSA